MVNDGPAGYRMNRSLGALMSTLGHKRTLACILQS
jgi:hypothetical protein